MLLKRLLGDVLADLGFVTREQLKEALHEQKKIYEKRVLPERLARADLVSEARRARNRETYPLLGEIMTGLGMISREQLNQALEEQLKSYGYYRALDPEKLGTVMEMGFMINSTLNLAEVLSRIMGHANQLMNSVASTLMLLDESTGELVFSVPTGPYAKKLTDLRMPAGRGIAGWVAQYEQPALVEDAEKDARHYAGIDQMTGFRTKSVLCVPLKAKAKLIGVLEAINKADGTAFSEEDALFLSIFASQAAVAIENARLYSELRKQLEKTKEMQVMVARSEKFEALGQMAAGVAHDFNNILSAIMGYSDITRYDVPQDSRARKNIDQVLKAGHRARELVQQILAFSRQHEQEKRPTQVHLILNEAIKLLRASFPSTIDIRQHITTNNDNVLADPTQIHQIIMNLCTNAQHAINNNGGVLSVSLKPIELDENTLKRSYPDLKPGAYLKLSIGDTGHGISDEMLDRIFDPYFTTKKKGVGTGMGLAVVHGIVKSHQGTVSVQSQVGKGTTFHVLLPIIEEEVGYESVQLEPLPVGDEQILFVDDEKSIVDMARQMLGDLGYKIIPRTSSIEALEAFRAQPAKFDLVVTDKTMPNMTGFDLAKKIKEIRPSIPIILCTGFSDTSEIQKARSMGVDEIVMKPIVMSDLAKIIRETLNGR